MKTKKRNASKANLRPIVGTIHPPTTLFFRQQVGTAENEKHTYDLTTQVNDNSPIVHSQESGKWFTLTWSDIINLAVKAGIDIPDANGRGQDCEAYPAPRGSEVL